MDYDYKNPMSYAAVSIPGISLIIEKMQISNLSAKIAEDINANGDCANVFSNSNSENKKISHIACWHIAGNIVQLIAIVALSSLMHPAIAALGLVACYGIYKNITYLGNQSLNIRTMSDGSSKVVFERG